MKTLLLLITAVSLISTSTLAERNYLTGATSAIDKNVWEPVAFVKNEHQILSVSLKEKYGQVRVFHCTAIFCNAAEKKYMLISNQSNNKTFLNIDNTTDITIRKIKY